MLAASLQGQQQAHAADAKAQRVNDVQATFREWAFGVSADTEQPASPTTGIDYVLHQSELRAYAAAIDEDDALRKEAALVQLAEDQYRAMHFRDQDFEYSVIVEAECDMMDRLRLQQREETGRYWVAEDEGNAFASVKYHADVSKLRAERTRQCFDLCAAEDVARDDVERAFLESMKEVMADERVAYLAARKAELAKTPFTPASTPTPPTPLTPTQPATQRESGHSLRPTLSTLSTTTDSTATPLVPKAPSARIPFVTTFVEECERTERRAILDGRDGFNEEVARVCRDMHGAAALLSRYAIECDEDVTRRAIASAYFDMLLQAAEHLEALIRSEIDVKQRRRGMRSFVPLENASWLKAKGAASQRVKIEEQEEVQRSKAEMEAQYDFEQAQKAERRALSGEENAGRVEVLHTEASERAILWHRQEDEYAPLREAAIRRELDAERARNTLVWTEASQGVCLVDERAFRKDILGDEARERHAMRSREMTDCLNTRRAETINIDVAKAIDRNYDDKARAMKQSQRQAAAAERSALAASAAAA